MVMIEAQANGLHCIKSDAVPSPNILGDVATIPLSADDDTLAEELAKEYPRRGDGVKEKMQKAGYDIVLEAKKLEDFYMAQ